MIHYFNNQYGGQTPEIFKLNLLKYLLVNNIVSNMEEFLSIIENVDINKDGFQLFIGEEVHSFKWMEGGISYPVYDYPTYI